MQMEDIKIIDIKVDDEAVNIGDIKTNVEQIYPELEDLEVIPSAEEQNFKSSKYGYDNVKVKAVEGKELNIVPTTEAQQYEGLYSKVNVNAIESEEITITPTATDQVKEGMYNKVTVAGDSDLIPENIKEGTSIFGVEGTMEGGFDTTQITSCSNMFNGNTELTEALSFNTSGSKSMENMYYGCSNLVKAPSYDVSNCTSIRQMYYNCKNLEEIGDFINSDKITDIYNFLYGCKKIKKPPFFNAKNVSYFNEIFSSLSALQTIPAYDTSNVTTFNRTFYGCGSLETIPKLNAGKVTNVGNMFVNCTILTNVGGFEDLGKAYVSTTQNLSSYKLDLSTSSKLTHESLINIINNLYDLNLTYDVANGGTLYTQSLVLGSTNLAKLTEGEIAIATNKGWNVS